MITVKALGQLKKYLNQVEGIQVEAEKVTTIGDAKVAAGVPVSVQTIVILNGYIATLDKNIVDGDVILLLAPVSGG